MSGFTVPKRFKVVELCPDVVADRTHAIAINNQGEILIRQFRDVYVTASLWHKGKLEPLKIPGISCFASAVNDHGQVVGSFGEDRDDQKGFLWDKGKFEILPTLGTIGAISNRHPSRTDALFVATK